MSDKSCIPDVLAMMRGGLSMRKSCEAVGVRWNTFLKWIDQDADLRDQYARARADMYDAMAEELEDIGVRATQATSMAEVSGLKLLADNRKWLLSKLASKKYGDRVELNVTQTLDITTTLQEARNRVLTLANTTPELIESNNIQDVEVKNPDGGVGVGVGSEK